MPGSIALVQRGDCDYTTKAVVAQDGGSAALVMINTDEGSLVSVIFPQIFYDLSLFYISYTESLNQLVLQIDSPSRELYRSCGDELWE